MAASFQLTERWQLPPAQVSMSQAAQSHGMRSDSDVAMCPAGFREVAAPDGCGPQLQQLSTSGSPVTRMRVLSLALSLAAASSSHATAIQHSGKDSSPQAHIGPC